MNEDQFIEKDLVHSCVLSIMNIRLFYQQNENKSAFWN